jgi:peptide/nickel transport system permease protein
MILYVVKRLFLLIPVILCICVITFVISRVIPADPAQVAAGLDAGPEQVETLRQVMGLDRPLPIQFFLYLEGLCHGDLGRSMRTRQPVMKDIQLYFPATLELTIVTMLFYTLVGIPLGIVSAATHSKLADLLVRVFAVSGTAMPIFWLGLLLQLLFYRQLRWLPAIGRLDTQVSAPYGVTGLYLVDSLLTANWPAFVNALRHILLPATTLVLGRLAVAVRMTRASMLDVLGKEYVRAARAKGLRERAVIIRHAFRNALIPIITLLALQFGWLLGGTIIVEAIFSWPGIGQYAVLSIIALDFAPIMGIAVLSAVIFTLLNLIVDVAYVVIDPRICY